MYIKDNCVRSCQILYQKQTEYGSELISKPKVLQSPYNLRARFSLTASILSGLTSGSCLQNSSTSPPTKEIGSKTAIRLSKAGLFLFAYPIFGCPIFLPQQTSADKAFYSSSGTFQSFVYSA